MKILVILETVNCSNVPPKIQTLYSIHQGQVRVQVGMKYLGKGTPTNPASTDRSRSFGSICSPTTLSVSQQTTKACRGRKAKVPMWKMKRRLLESFRDLALQDREFAELMVPVFQELTQYKGKLYRKCLGLLLAHIETK